MCIRHRVIATLAAVLALALPRKQLPRSLQSKRQTARQRKRGRVELEGYSFCRATRWDRIAGVHRNRSQHGKAFAMQRNTVTTVCSCHFPAMQRHLAQHRPKTAYMPMSGDQRAPQKSCQ